MKRERSGHNVGLSGDKGLSVLKSVFLRHIELVVGRLPQIDDNR